MYAFANAKINIGLNVIERRPDGYHNIESVFMPIPLCDTLELCLAGKNDPPYTFFQTGYPLDCKAEDNLVVRIFQALQKEFRLPPSEIHLHKRIPSGAGLGGGSSDAAEIAKMINEFFELGLSASQLAERVAHFGADCAFFVANRPTYVTGIGTELTDFPLNLQGFSLALVKPPIFISTKEAYAGVIPHKPAYDLRESLSRPVETWCETVVNDFETSVFPVYPTISAIKQTLYDMGAQYASMSGSGSSIFGLFTRPVDELAAVFPDCFTFTSIFR
ncbi:MAG: 4-(cytidine 5'-diphospho)-2-C-methyl-D-erythritol kinase [Christensenellaceae bacterium]|nr:4-(cytidine 5'-diphospho)-2-C-methyl-D-erythritol kinase [Christensenellaceae bacterium]